MLLVVSDVWQKQTDAQMSLVSDLRDVNFVNFYFGDVVRG